MSLGTHASGVPYMKRLMPTLARQRRAYRHMPPKKSAATRKKAVKPKSATAPCASARKARMPTIIHPMLATLVDDPFPILIGFLKPSGTAFDLSASCATARRNFFLAIRSR
jgi:hypothetical protein